MSKPPADDSGVINSEILAKLLELQQQTSEQVLELRRALKAQRASKGPRKRRGPVAYSPPSTSPGPEPSEMQRAWARKILRQYGWQ